MQDPLKIIHKFKNNNRKIQYITYIYIGSLVPENIITILKSIYNKDFYTSLDYLNIKNYNILANYYGEFWYEKIFISNHIYYQKNLINNTNIKKTNLESKYGKEWYNTHIKDISIKLASYSFSAAYYYKNLLINKIKPKYKKKELDYRTYNTNTLNGGAITNDDDDNDDNDDNDNDNDNDNEIYNEELNNENLEEQIETSFNLEDIINIYLDTNNQKPNIIHNTSKLISEAIKDKKWEKNILNNMIEYDNNLDNIGYDMKLEDIYMKYYIYDQYIYKDDTIKTLRNKISATIPISPKFNENIKLLPETIYLWSSYRINNNNIDNVMIGQKWSRRYELLKIDIIPNENIKIYEELRNNLEYLKDYLGIKIKREDDESNIIKAYEEFITMNEIFILDIYNELGLNYIIDGQNKKNLYDVYINIYYPYISLERFNQILQLLNNENINEIQYIENQYISLINDLKIETEIENLVESTKIKLNDIEQNTNKILFNENYIIQSIIHVNIYDILNNENINIYNINTSKINLYRIFDNFIVNDIYPFIQYYTSELQLIYKFYTINNKIEEQELLSKWFEYISYGISIKIKIDDNKYISINLHETGRIEYKIIWKEEDNATVNDIIKTYDYIRNLILKINSENNKIKLILPSNDKFKYAFINTILKFSIPNKYIINHNDLSELCRYFYNYLSLVIEPKKRLSKNINENTVSKYGTYLRYKRINKYDNRVKMHIRILYILKNYEINNKDLIDEIAKQFNTTLDYAAKEINIIQEKYKKIIQRSKKKKLLSQLPKSKPSGIGIDIQGRKDNYKIRITGARDEEQLKDIIDLMRVLIFLYIETYLLKKKEYQKIKDKLKSLVKIAKRRNKVLDTVDYENNINDVKKIISLDKDRLGFKPSQGQNQWTRSCQNSGNDTKRRPIIIEEEYINNLIKAGYKLNKNNNLYEKEIKIKNKLVTLKALKLPGQNNTFNYFTCNPNENKDYTYIGFLSRGNNPNNLCMPCCYKKDQSLTNNKKKLDYFYNCINNTNKLNNTVTNKIALDKIYILQDSLKIHNSRYIFLEKYLDIFFNKKWNNDYKIKNHYLIESKTGYFFKYTIKHDVLKHESLYLLYALSDIYNLSIPDIIDKFLLFLEKDKNDKYFTYLNNGDIKSTFKTKDKYIEFIKNNYYLEYEIIGDLSTIPNVISTNGINYYIFTKNTILIKNQFEKDITQYNYYLECLNTENNYQLHENRDIIILLKEGKYYFPIYKLQKNPNDKNINIIKYYKKNNITDELYKYLNKNCNNIFVYDSNLIAKNIINILDNFNIKIINQIIDEKNKCKYILIDNNLLIPTKPSGIHYKYNYILYDKYDKFLNLFETIKLLKNIEDILKLNYIPKSVFYDKKKNNKIHIISILLFNNLSLPILHEYYDTDDIKKMNLSIIHQPLDIIIDNAIKNNNNDYDNFTKNVKEHIYNYEAYNLYRLEISYFLQKNNTIKNNIINIVRNNNINKKLKYIYLRLFLLYFLSKKLGNKYKLENKNIDFNNKLLIDNLSFNTLDKFSMDIVLIDKLPNLQNYYQNNIRDTCNIYTTNNSCNNNFHCIWNNNTCKFKLLENIAIDYVNKIIEEMIYDNIKFKEIIQENNYYVSDIIDYTRYTYRNNQKIIKTSNININKIIDELFDKENIPILGKRYIIKNKNITIDNNIELIKLGKQYIQEIIPNKNTVIRAYINSYYWIMNPLYDINSRNLGYNNDFQTSITFLFKANIIDFLKNNINNDIKNDLLKYFNNSNDNYKNFIKNFNKSYLNTNGIIELYVLSYLINIPIIVYDNYSNIKYIFLQGCLDINNKTIKNFTNEDKIKNTIILKFNFDDSLIPKNIYSIYYI